MTASRVAARVLRAARLGDRHVEVVFVSDAEMRDLNRRFRGVDRTTDVLSFSSVEGDVMPGAEDELGSLVVSLDTAARQARGLGHSVDEELAVLLVHGLTHLLGFDHERGADEAREMAEREMTLLAATGVDPLLALTGRAL